MKINSVKLKNYRSHEDRSIQFDKGINLLLGSNGAGKSSVLEAIGLALFDTGLRGTKSDAVRNGNSSGTIIVNFTANDGYDYISEIRIGGSSRRQLRRSDSSGLFLEGEDALKKTIELSGIENNAKNIYDNLISASQNKITEIFLGTNASRSGLFNKIFDTEIYGKIWSGFAKEAGKKYEVEIAKVTSKIDELTPLISDMQELKENKKKLKETIDNLVNEKDAVISGISELNKFIKEMTRIKAELEKNNQEITSLENLIIERKEALKKEENEKSASARSLEIIDKNKDSYNKYKSIEKEAENVGKKLEHLRKLNEEKNRIEKEIIEFNSKINVENNRISNLEEKITENNNRLAETEKLLKELNDEKGSVNEKLKLLKQEINITKSFSNNFTAYSKSSNDEKISQDRLKDKKETLSNSLIDIEDAEKKIKELGKEIELTEKKIIERDKLKENRNIISAKISELKRSAKKLSTGICPFLKEECLNIKDGGSTDNYFNHREISLQSELYKIDKELKLFDGISNKKQESISKLELIRNDIKKTNEILHEIEIVDKELELSNKNISILQNDIDNEIIKLRAKYPSITQNNPSEIISQLDIVSEEYNNSKIESENRIKFIDEKSDTLIIEQNNINNSCIDSLNAKDKSLKLLSRINIEIQKDRETLEFFHEDLAKLPATEAKFNKLTNKIKKLKPSYDLYIGNRDKALRYDEHLNECKKISIEIENNNMDMENLVKEKKLLENSFDENELVTAGEKKKTLEDNKEKLISLLASSQKDLEQIKQKIKLNNELKEKIRNYKSDSGFLIRKKELTSVFRKNLQSMGKNVAAGMMKEIEIKATENFRRISARPEYIRWINNNGKSYMVYLCTGNSNEEMRSFEQLSGGEQVMAALSIRAAMASMMTRANFAIFDEPTVNLDIERRVTLSESLKDILANLEQAIIVTHDGTFEDMAQKTINL